MTDSSNKTKEQLEMVNIEQDPVNALDICLNTLNHVNYRFLTGEPVASIQSGQIKPDEKGHYIKAAVNWFKEWMAKNGHGQEFENGQLGTIIIAPSGIKSAMSHKPHPIDVQALPALPLIIEKAVVLSRTMDDMGKPLENIVVAAPIEIDAKKYYMVVRLRRHTEDKNDKPRFYTQAVTIAEDIKKGHIPSDQVTGQNKLLTQNGGRVRLLNVLYTALSVNNLATSIVTGRTNTVKTPKGTKLDTVFALVEADNIIASHDATGGTNPKFPQELQPRDRSREASQTWVQKTAANLDPDSLGKTSRADTGAPIVGDDLIVESGNGRTMAIQLAYARGTADEYHAWLVDEAEYFGFKPEQVEAFKQPVLVRIRKTEIDRAAFAVEANQDDKLSLSATERAKADARRIDDNMAMLFNPSEDGDLLAASNQKFIRAFLQSIGDTEAAQYIGTDGKPTQALVSRIKAAVFSKAYRDDRLLEMVADQTKPDLKNMLNALSVAAPKFIEAQAISRLQTEDLSSQIVDGIESATDQKVIDAIIAAANVVMTAKNDNQDVTEFVKQQGLFGDLPDGVPELAVFLSKNAGSAKKMSLLFKAMASFLEKQAIDQSNNSLFGDPEPLSMREVIQHAASVLEQEYGVKANLNMFDDIFGPEFFDQIFKKCSLSKNSTETHIMGKILSLTRIFYANEWAKEKRYDGFMHDPHSRRKLRFCLSDAKDNFYIEVKDSDDSFVAEVGNCKDKDIESIISFINEFLDEDHPVIIEKAAFDSFYTEADVLRHYHLRSDIDQLAHAAATSPYNDLPEPTEEQKLSGDYPKGEIQLQGFSIYIENPAGSTRTGKDEQGNTWSNRMAHHYGYFVDTMGADGDEVDVFVKSGCSSDFAGPVFVIDQINPDGTFDEHKVVLGAANEEEARDIYLSNYEKDWTGLGGITEFSHDDFKDWLFSDKAQSSILFDGIGASLFNDQLNQIDVEADPLGALEICLLVFGSDDELSDDPNSPNYRYRDTGYIADSRKELAANNITLARKSGVRLRATDIDWEAIETNPRQAADLIIKANLFGKTDWHVLQDAGMEAAAGFLIDKIYASIAPEPTSALPALNFLSSNDLIKIAGATDTDALAQTRKDYARGLETIRDRLENKLTVAEVLQVITEIRDEINGIQLTSEQATQLDQLKDQLQEKQANLRELKGKNDRLFKDWYAYDRKIGSLQYEQTKRLNRKWKPDPEIAKQISELKVLAEEADKTYKEWRAAHPELESKERGDGTWISYDNDLEYEIRLLREQASKIKKLAQFNNLVFNPSTRAWLVMGERFLNMLNYRSYSGSDSFAGHVTNAKAGKIKDWSWADKTKPKTPRKATKQEISFQLKVADTYERVGGKAVVAESTQALENMLGLRAVQSGNWVLKDPNSAKFHVENTAAAMSDLSDILGIDTNLLGFGGRLGLAFGARGVGGKDAAAAHYESVHRVINLTKMRGGGALGHEWFHSMDNMLHEMVRQEVNGGKREFVTLDPALLPKGKIQDAVVALKKAMFEGTVRPLQQMIYTAKDVSQAKYNIDNPRNNVSRAIKQAGNAVDAVIVLKEQFAGRIREKDFKKWLTMAIAYYHEGTTEVDTRYEKILKVGDPGSSFAAEAIRLDEGIAERYWSRHHEMAARAFQSYLEDSLATQNRRNDYLSALADNKHHYDPLFDIQYNPYPEGEERIRINAAFDKLFAAIRDEQVFQKAVGNKELMDSMFPNVSFTGLALEPAC